MNNTFINNMKSYGEVKNSSKFFISSNYNTSGFIMSESINVSDANHLDLYRKQFSQVQRLERQSNLCELFRARLHEKTVIIKRLKSEFAKLPDICSLFYNEFKNSYNLDHPNIVRVFDYATDSQGPYYVMEYIDGVTLAEVINSQAINDGELIKSIAVQILEALNYIHKQKIYHRDLRPENILITKKENQVKIIDFGLSSNQYFADNIIALDNGIYTAPELRHIDDNSICDDRADIYSFGVIFRELLVGKENQPHLANLRFPLLDVVDRCTEKDINLRISNCETLLKTLVKVKIPTFQETETPILKTMFNKQSILKNEKYYWGVAVALILFFLSFTVKFLFSYFIALSVMFLVCPSLVLVYLAICEQDSHKIPQL